MKADDFRYMRRGKQIGDLSPQDLHLLQAINHRQSSKTERALLVLHGFSSSPAVYRYLIPQITGYDAIVCPVLPGHADSIQAFSRVKATDWLATAQTHCASLIKEYKKVDVLGLSLGGLLACELAQQYPINHLYLLAPALKLHMNIPLMLKIAKFLKCLGFHNLRNRAGNILAEQYAEIAYRKLPLTTVIEMLQFAQRYQWTPPHCPVDLFLGLHDEVVASKEVEELFMALPEVKIHWLNRSAHVLPLDDDINEMIQCLNQHHSD